MAITHGSETFSYLHGVILESKAEMPLYIGRFAGVRGEEHITDRPKGKMLQARYHINGFASATLLQAHLEAIDNLAGVLTGALAITGTAAASYGYATFLGFEPDAPAQIDGKNNLWFINGTLKWRRRNL